ncbi:MAG: CapA family protein, partial [Clostridia bacterium]|nr:CapA family protein [Clostridia bacterium]
MKKTSLILTVFAAVLIAALIITSLALGKNTAEPVSGDEISSPESSNASEDAEQSGVPSEESPDESPAPSEDEPSSDVTGEEESSAVSASESSEPVEESSEPKEESSEPKEESSEPVEESSEPKEESSEPVTIPPDGKDRVVHFLACPDNIIHPSVYYDALERAAKNAGKKPDYSSLGTAEYDFSPIYENVAAHIAAADLAYINVETLIGGNQNKISGYPTFNTPEAAGEYLVKLGFDIMNVAHNHMLDSKDDKYLKNCYNFFTQRGKTVIGYYKNDAAVDNIVVVEKNGI